MVAVESLEGLVHDGSVFVLFFLLTRKRIFLTLIKLMVRGNCW